MKKSRLVAVGVITVAGIGFGLFGAGAAQADTTPAPISISTQFDGLGHAATKADAESAAVAAAMANEAAFEKASGATCTNSATMTQSFQAGDQFVAEGSITATCMVPVPMPPAGS